MKNLLVILVILLCGGTSVASTRSPAVPLVSPAQDPARIRLGCPVWWQIRVFSQTKKPAAKNLVAPGSWPRFCLTFLFVCCMAKIRNMLPKGIEGVSYSLKQFCAQFRRFSCSLRLSRFRLKNLAQSVLVYLPGHYRVAFEHWILFHF